jgi:hypothetical protein
VLPARGSGEVLTACTPAEHFEDLMQVTGATNRPRRLTVLESANCRD